MDAWNLRDRLRTRGMRPGTVAGGDQSCIVTAAVRRYRDSWGDVGVLLLSVCAIVFAFELALMEALPRWFPRADPQIAALADSLLLALSIAPLLYFLFRRHAAAHERLLEQRLFALETELRSAQVDLTNQRHAFDQHSIIAVTDTRGTITYVNDLATKITGYARHELVGQNHRLLNSGHHPKEFFADLWSTLVRGEVWRGEICNRAKDGSLYWVDSTMVPLLQPEGRPYGYVSIRTDITGRRRAEDTLRDSRQYLDLALSGADLGAWNADLASGSAVFDARWCEMLGLQPDEVEPRIDAWRARTHPEDLAGAAAEFDRHVRGETQRFDSVFRMRHRDGRWIWIQSRGRIVARDVGGRPLRMSGTHMDVTDHVAVSEALREAKESAESANRAKSEFLAAMSHEIRTPMNGVLGFVDLLLETKLDETQHRYATTVRNSSENLLTLVNDILDLSKIEAGKLRLEILELDLRRIVADVMELLTARAAETGVQISVDVSPDIPAVLVGEPSRTRQVLLNLVGNAVKFSPGGAVLVRVASTIEHGQRTVRVEVVDTGIGIQAAQLAGLFQPFTQAESSTSRRFGGSGLGLVISRRLVDAMGGRLGVESVFGEGSTFWFTLPLVEPDAAQRGAAAQSPRPAAIEPSELARDSVRRVLVAEDVEVNQTLVTTLLARLGWDADIAADGNEAIALYRSRPYSLVLMDCLMPGMSGFEATGHIREIELARGDPLQHTPIVALTASATAEDRERCIAAGMDDFLSKPIRRAELADMVERWTRGPSPGRSLSVAAST